MITQIHQLFLSAVGLGNKNRANAIEMRNQARISYPVARLSLILALAGFLTFTPFGHADDSLVASWPLNEGLGSVATDVSGNGNDGTLTNNPTWNGDELSFDGVDDYVDVGDLDVAGNSITITGRFRADNLASCSYRDCRIISKAVGTATEDHYLMVSTVKSGSSSTHLRFRLKAGGSTTTLIANAGSLENNVWVHFAAVYDGAKMLIYKDGDLVGSLAKSGNINTNSSVPVWIGANPTQARDRPWDGSIADVNIYSRALAADEISALQSPNQKPSFTSIPVTSAREGVGYLYNIAATDPDTGDALSILATTKPAWLSFSANGGNASLSGVPGIGDVGAHEVVLAVSDLDNATSRQSFTIQVSAASSGGDGLVAHWPLNEGGGLVANDQSGKGNNGELVNGPSWTGNSLNLDGTNDYVNVGTIDVPGAAMTLAGWIRADDLSNCSYRDCRIFSKAVGTDTNDHYIMLSTVKAGSATRLRFRLMTNGVTGTLIASSGNLSNNEWVHVAAVYDGNNMLLYKDGEQVGSVPKSGNITTNNSAQAWIGGNPPSSSIRPWDGSISDLRLYSRALTGQEIRDLRGDVNSPPSFSSNPVSVATENQPYVYNITASDPDQGDVLTIAASTLPAWLSIDDNGNGTALLSGTPGSAGNYSVVLEVADQDNATSEQRFAIGVIGGGTGGGSGDNLVVLDINRPVVLGDHGFPGVFPSSSDPINGNWFSPINYAEGTLHVRVQIRSQPVAQTNKMQFCIWQYNYTLETCSRQLHTVTGTPGNVVTWTETIESMWKMNGVPMDWAGPRQRYAVAIKNAQGNPVSDYNSWDWYGENENSWYPLDMRFTVVLVPKGGSFGGWNDYIR